MLERNIIIGAQEITSLIHPLAKTSKLNLYNKINPLICYKFMPNSQAMERNLLKNYTELLIIPY